MQNRWKVIKSNKYGGKSNNANRRGCEQVSIVQVCVLATLWQSVTLIKVILCWRSDEIDDMIWPYCDNIVGKTSRHVCASFQACCAIICQWSRKYWFFTFCCENWHKRWMNWHPESLRHGQTCFFMVFHAILRLISNRLFCAIYPPELSVCAIFNVFSKCDWQKMLISKDEDYYETRWDQDHHHDWWFSISVKRKLLTPVVTG